VYAGRAESNGMHCGTCHLMAVWFVFCDSLPLQYFLFYRFPLMLRYSYELCYCFICPSPVVTSFFCVRNKDASVLVCEYHVGRFLRW
jgi:hypothetical protein